MTACKRSRSSGNSRTTTTPAAHTTNARSGSRLKKSPAAAVAFALLALSSAPSAFAFSQSSSVRTASHASSSALARLSPVSASSSDSFSTSGDDMKKNSWNSELQAQLDAKNVLRKKYGLSAWQPHDLLDHLQQVQEVEKNHLEQHAAALKAQQGDNMLSAHQKHSTSTASSNIFEQLLDQTTGMVSSLLEDECQSHLDCARPQHCCDLGGLVRKCCASGQFVPEYALEPVPVDMRQ